MKGKMVLCVCRGGGGGLLCVCRGEGGRGVLCVCV